MPIEYQRPLGKYINSVWDSPIPHFYWFSPCYYWRSAKRKKIYRRKSYRLIGKRRAAGLHFDCFQPNSILFNSCLTTTAFFKVCLAELYICTSKWYRCSVFFDLLSFGVRSFGVRSFGVRSFGIRSFGVPSFGVRSFGVQSFSVPSFGVQ